MAFCRQTARHLCNLNKYLYWKPLRVNAVLETVPITAYIASPSRCYSKSNVNEENVDPVRFSTSEASQWKASYSRAGANDDDSPPSQPYIVTLSLTVFLIYFLVLREENDIDLKIGGGGDFGDTQTYLEFIQLKTIVENNAIENIETEERVLVRLKELESLSSFSK